MLASCRLNYFNEGTPAFYPDGRYEKVIVGPDILNGQRLQLTVPGGTYKAAELTAGEYSLVSEAVAPGWEPEDIAGYRKKPVHIRTSRRASLADIYLRDCMDALKML